MNFGPGRASLRSPYYSSSGFIPPNREAVVLDDELTPQNPGTIRDRIRARVVLLLVFVVCLADLPTKAQSEDFDHFQTRFPLDGAHKRLKCDSCHRNGLFRGTPTRCGVCHDGTGLYAVTAASNRHIPHTGSDCGSCHQSRRWELARVEHSVVSGRCETCHNDVYAEGKSQYHIASSNHCRDCHRTTTWGRAEYGHAGTAYPGDHRGNPRCAKCHGANNNTVNWTSPSYKPTCAGCHASDFERDEHKKVASPRQYYTVGELRDCSGSCHTYTDPTLTTIDKRRSREHRVRDSDFD